MKPASATSVRRPRPGTSVVTRPSARRGSSFIAISVASILALVFLMGCSGSSTPVPPAPTASPTAAPSAVAPLTSTEPTSAPTASPSAGTSAPSGSALDGDWTGSWTSTSTAGVTGTFTLTVAFQVQSMAGTIAVKGTPCISAGTVTGTLNGTAISFGVVSGSQTIAYTGKVAGTTMSGTYQTGENCGNDKGTWQASKG
jgi:hypothetical protein